MKKRAAFFFIALACARAPEARLSAQDFLLDPSVQERLAAIRAEAGKLGALSEAALGQLSVSTGSIAPVSRYPVRGLDVSHHNNDKLPGGKTLDWDKVKGQGFSFVFIKATEGKDLVDGHFAANWRGAQAAGLARGAYHFYNFCAGGAEQARNFLRTVPRDPDALPPTIDLEVSGSCRKMPAKAAFMKEFSILARELELAYGRRPILYMGAYLYGLYFKGEKDDYPIWFTDSRQEPNIPDNKRWTFWQYAYFGDVDGVGDQVDLDVFNGTPEQFAAWMNPAAGVAAWAAPWVP